MSEPFAVGLMMTLCRGSVVSLASSLKVRLSIVDSIFEAHSSRARRLPLLAFGKLALGKDAPSLNFQRFHGDGCVATAADDVFGHPVGRDAFTGLGDAVFRDADNEQNICPDQSAQARPVIDDVVVSEALLGEEFLKISSADE